MIRATKMDGQQVGPCRGCTDMEDEIEILEAAEKKNLWVVEVGIQPQQFTLILCLKCVKKLDSALKLVLEFA